MAVVYVNKNRYNPYTAVILHIQTILSPILTLLYPQFQI